MCAAHWVQLRTSKSTEFPFSHARLRTEGTKRPGSRETELADGVQAR